jgi:branched-chain amino acid transport system substrate-binding protein
MKIAQNRNRVSVFGFRLSLAALLCALAPPARAAAPLKVKIGIINSVTGSEAPIGETFTNGYRLAVEDLAKKGIEVELISEDDTGKPQIAMSGFDKLVREGVVGMVGPYLSQSATPVTKLAERNKVPLVIPTAAKEELTRQGYQYVFRISAPADVLASTIIDAALSMGKPKSIALLYENTDFGNSTGKTAHEYALKKGLSIVAEESYSKGSPDYRSTLNGIKEKSPDLLFMVSYVADAILLMRQARELGLKPQAFLGGGAGFTTPVFAKEKEISNLVLASTHWTPDANWPGAREFGDRYTKRFGSAPSYHAACGYESLRILAEAAASVGGTDRVKTQKALRDGKWNGIMGEVKFADYSGYTNQNNHQVLVEQLQGGKYETVFPAELATKKPIYPFPGWK